MTAGADSLPAAGLDRPSRVTNVHRVAIKWVVHEPYSEQARALRRDAAVRREQLIAPPHFTGEVVNGLYRRIYRANETAR